MDFKNELNEEQYAAATAPDGAALVVAAAGTGKTRTLIYRLAYLVQEKGVPPWEVLLLTFTNKAAKEMLARAEKLVHQRFDTGTVVPSTLLPTVYCVLTPRKWDLEKIFPS
jgi:DNA helicase-2/ATP-dependent DNA helicase PcrA